MYQTWLTLLGSSMFKEKKKGKTIYHMSMADKPARKLENINF